MALLLVIVVLLFNGKSSDSQTHDVNSLEIKLFVICLNYSVIYLLVCSSGRNRKSRCFNFHI